MKEKRVPNVHYVLGLTLLIAALPPLALAGEGSGRDVGNGGIGIVCRHLKGPKKGKPKSVQLLDLAEFAGFVPESKLDVQTQFDQAMSRLTDAGLESIAQKLVERDTWISTHTGSPEGGLPLTFYNDALDRVSENSECRHEQIATYDIQSEMLSLDASLHALLTKTGKTALRIHEAVYAIAAAAGATDSKLSRQFVRTLLHPGSSPLELRRALPFSLNAREEHAYMLKAPSILLKTSGPYTHADFVGTYVDLTSKDRSVYRFELGDDAFVYRRADIEKLNPGDPLQFNDRNEFYGLNGPRFEGARLMRMAHATSAGLLVIWTFLDKHGDIAHQLAQTFKVDANGDVVVETTYREGGRDDVQMQTFTLKRVQE